MPYVIGSQFEQLPQWYRDILQSFIEQTERLRQQEYPEYPGARVAEVPPFIAKSHELAQELGKAEPYYAQAREYLIPSTLPYQEQLQPYLNPYLENVINAIGRHGRRFFEESVLPGLEAKFVKLGQHGSSRHKDLSLRAARDLQEAILEKQQEALSRGHEQATSLHGQEKLRNIESARSLANLGTQAQSSQQQSINALNALGAQQQAHQQQILNEQQAEFWRRQTWPTQALQQQASILHGIPSPGGGATSMQYTPPQAIPQLNPLGQAGATAAQLYGMANLPRQFKKGGKVKGKIPLSKISFRKVKKRSLK